MDEHAATFPVDSKTDAFAVEHLTERLYDAIREESRTIRSDSSDSTAMLAEFEAIREAARDHRPGRLRVVLYQAEGPFEE